MDFNIKLKFIIFLLCFAIVSNIFLFVVINKSQAITMCGPGDQDQFSCIIDILGLLDPIRTAVSVIQLAANITGADWLGQIAQQFQTILNYAQVLNFDRNNYEAADQTMREVLRLVLNEFHRLLIAFINGKGDPKVIKDFNKEFRNLADKAAGEMLNAIAGTNLCNKNWGIYAKLLYLEQPKISNQFKCSLSDIARQMQATAGVSVSVETVGFDEFARMFEPQNNFLGSFLMASSGQGAKMSEAKTIGTLEALSFSGMKAAKNEKGEIITPGSAIAEFTRQGAVKDYDLWARQLSKITPYRGSSKNVALDVASYILDVGSVMAKMAVESGLVNISESDLADENMKYAQIGLDDSKSGQAANDYQDSKTLSGNLKRIKEELKKTVNKLNEIIPVVERIVNTEKGLAALLVSKMNESSGLVCGFSSFNQYLSVSSSLVSSKVQGPSTYQDGSLEITETITTEKYSVNISDADTGENYITGAEITKTTVVRQITDNSQEPPSTTTTTTITYSADNAGIPFHQADLTRYKDYLAAYKATQAKIDGARSDLAEFEAAAKKFSDAGCAVATVNGVPQPRPAICDSLEAEYDAAKIKAVKSIQTVIFTLSGKYAYATAGAGVDLDVNENGTVAEDEKNMENEIDNLDSELSRHYESLYGLYQELTKDNMDGGACKYRGQGAEYASGYYLSQGIYKTKYCLNDAYSFANGVLCVQQQQE